MIELTDLVQQGLEWYNKLSPVYREIYLLTGLTAVFTTVALSYSYLKDTIERRRDIKRK